MWRMWRMWRTSRSAPGRLCGVTTDAIPDSPALLEAHRILASGAAQILPADGLLERLRAAGRESRALRVKLGIDPSGADLTLGHAVVLRKLRQFQDLGHTAVLVVGGFTGQVGDPSGRTATRVAQSEEQVARNAQGYFDQVMRILDPERTEVVDNSAWLSSMNLSSLLSYTQEITVARLLERDDFARRFAAHEPISLSEFFYPLLQGIDSVEIRADVELGGTDQTYNNLVGRDLQRGRGQAPQAVLTLPLLVGLDGVEKMGKSLGNYVALGEPADQQFGKLMSIPDSAIATYAALCTDLHPDEVQLAATAAAAGGADANLAKRAVARAIVALYHGHDAAAAAEESFDALFRRRELPTDLPGIALPPGDSIHLPALIVEAGLAPTASAARRHIDAGAVRVDGEPLAPRSYDIARGDLAGRVLSLGRRRHVRITAG
jgi:tyrosyl-tRNA synthetase